MDEKQTSTEQPKTINYTLEIQDVKIGIETK